MVKTSLERDDSKPLFFIIHEITRDYKCTIVLLGDSNPGLANEILHSSKMCNICTCDLARGRLHDMVQWMQADRCYTQ